MRWFVEVSRVGDSTPAERYCVEAKAWQAALQETRKLRGDSGPLSKFSIELLDDGYRAVDPIQKIRYLVNQAPSDAPLVLPMNGSGHVSNPPAASASSPPPVGVPSAPPAPSVAPPVVAATSVAPLATISRMPSSPPAVVAHGAVASVGASSSPSAARTSVAPAVSGGLSVSVAPAPVAAVAKGLGSIVPRPSPSRRKATPLTLDNTPPPPAVAPVPAEPTAAASPGIAAEVDSAPATAAPPVAPAAPAVSIAPAAIGAAPAVTIAPAVVVTAPMVVAPEVEKAEPPVVAPSPPVAPQTEPPSDGLPAYRVFMSRAQEPKPEAPITYREQACVVDPGTSREAVEALLRERWLTLKDELASKPSGRLVQIAVFDHAFENRPQRPPLGTLAWKDWRGQPVLGFPGFGEAPAPVSSSMPPAPPEAAPSAAEPAAEEEAQPMLLQRPALSSQPDSGGGTAKRDSRPSIAGRRRAGEDLISELFELMHELHFARDIVFGAEFVLGVLAELIPSEYTMVSVFNINTRKFVVVRARGPGAQSAIMHSTADSDPLLADVMRRGGSRAFKTSGDGRFTSGRFATFKFPLEQLLCGPVRQGGRYLGVIEVGNPLGGKPFHESEINALDYICGQFAEFVASHPVVLDADVVLGR